ncbi:MAG TPA: SusC/RagA family TonB-linked outer membrane protein [Bacteroidales bacterium]|nr:SusC/RagA family TonB-linked outer membrane protein [Bacteroidales bacterium]
MLKNKKNRMGFVQIQRCMMLFLVGVLVYPWQLVAQTGTLSLNVQNVPLKDVLKQIEQKSTYTFLYQDVLLKDSKPVRVRIDNRPLAEVLRTVLTPSGLTYEVDDNVLILKRTPSVSEVQVTRIVRGQVLDQDQLTLPGATVLVKNNPSLGVVTDIDGNYSIKVPADTEVTLKVSYIGMETQEIALTADQQMVDIRLKPSEVVLTDFVVVGAYGTEQKRSDLVGSAFQVNAKQLENLPAGRIDNLLDGMVPGLKIDFNTDLASNTRPRYNVRVRGSASLSASNEPLWIIDGTPVYTGDRTNMVPGMSMTISPLSYYNSDDIESITVLKDAASTSIYGADGANGVILVTTKKGKSDSEKPSLTVSTRFGVSKINETTRFKVLNADQYMELAKESYANAGRDAALFPFQDNAMNAYSTTDTDWSKVYYDLGNTRQTGLSLRGANKHARYYLSGSYYGNNMTVKGNQSDRFSLRSNADFDLTSRISFGINLSSSYNVNTLFNPGDDYYQILPIFSPYNADGSMRLYNTYVDGKDVAGDPVWSTVKFFNSVAEREENDHRQRSMSTQANAELKIKIMEGLLWTNQLGIDYLSSFEDTYSARSNWSGMSSQGPYGYAYRGHANFLNLNLVERLNFNRKFGVHQVGGLVGFEMSSKEYNTLSASGSGFVNDHIKEVSYATDRSGSSSYSLTRGMSLFAQGSYSYDQRYYVLFNTRMDGRSNFGPDVRWAEFASMGFSWNAQNETFLEAYEAINVMKFKLSYGTNGNSRLGSLEALGLYSYSSNDQYAGMPGASMSGSPNPTLSWETTYMTNIGLRVRFLDRYDIDIEAYNNKTVDLLSNLDVSRTTGDTRVYRNVGKIQNRGIEANIEVDLYSDQDWDWSASFNASHNRNKLLELYNGESKVMGEKIWQEGKDINTYYVIRWAGVDPRDGAPMWYDARGNVTRVYDTNNRVVWKTSSPIATGGFSSMLQYRAFSLNMMFNYVLGGYSFSNFGRRVSSDGLNIMDDNQSVNQLDRWQKPGDQALSPKPLWGVSTKSVMNSTRYIYSTTHLKLRNVALSYRVPANMVQKIGAKTAHVSLIADNLGVWTPYDQPDRNSYRQAMSGYPMETMFSLGLDVTL